MDYSLFIWATASFIETRLQEPIDYSELEKTIGFSYRHIRETFKECTGITLSRYILLRRLANSAFDIVNTGKSLTEIASDYMFNSYDTFTRAYKRHINKLPSDFRNGTGGCKVGRQRILVGMFAPMIITNESSSGLQPDRSFPDSFFIPPQLPEVDYNMRNIEKTEDSCILFGVPKVSYSCEGCTPLCVAMKSCLNYMGQQIDYPHIMAITGAAFRLRWNTAYFDGGNVDIMNIYEDRYEVFRRAFDGAGRSYLLLKRENSNKEEFKMFIKAEIDEGRPVIAFGIIGPPEACLITGYQENAGTLLGWNCFQENHEFAKDVSIDKTGYFITDTWWENECTIALISVGEKQEALGSSKESILNAIDILTKQQIIYKEKDRITEYAGGQRAYELWAEAIADDKNFPANAVLPYLFERIMCQNDAQTMVGEGRYYAACYMEQVGKEFPVAAEPCRKASDYFRKTAECTFKMDEIKGGLIQDEAAIRRFAEPEIRKQIVPLIYKAKEFEAKACEQLKEIAALL